MAREINLTFSVTGWHKIFYNHYNFSTTWTQITVLLLLLPGQR